jgi:hypothetical protein
VGCPTVCVMAEKPSSHLRVVDSARNVVVAAPEDSRSAYWAKVQALRDERQRLRAG